MRGHDLSRNEIQWLGLKRRVGLNPTARINPRDRMRELSLDLTYKIHKIQ